MDPREEDLGRRSLSSGGAPFRDSTELPGGRDSQPCEESPVDLAGQRFPPRVDSTPDTQCTSYPLARRGYKHEVPHRYPWFRDNLLGHLRSELSLTELASVSLGQVHYSSNSLEILGKTISKRSAREVFESFLEIRSELGKAYPHLVQDPSAPFFAARDGGPLLVSHRPLGVRERGLERFVELRDQLADFLFRHRDHKTLEQNCTMTMKEFDTYVKNNRKLTVQATTLESLSCEYKEARKVWFAEVNELVNLLKGYSLKKSSLLGGEIARLEDLHGSASLEPEEQRRLCELRVIRQGLDGEERARIREDLLTRKNRAAQRRLELSESIHRRLIEYPDEEPPMPSIMPVYEPNPRALFCR